MATMLETPSRIWRRIEAIEDADMPSLPSLPPFDNSAEAEEISNEASLHENDDQFEDEFESTSSPLHSTPASTQHTLTSANRGPSSTSSTARFAHSIASRSNKSAANMTSSRGMSSRRSQHDSFEVPSLPRIAQIPGTPGYRHETEDDEDEETRSSVPDVYLPPEEDEEGDRDFSLTDALQSVSRSSSPPFPPQASREATPKKNYDYSVSLKSEPKASPFEKYRNVALRRTNPRTRTPSLSRTSSSSTSSPAHSTPQSNRSFALPRSQTGSPVLATATPLPRSTTASPAVVVRQPEDEDQSIEAPDFSSDTQEHGARSMDITDVHVSPPRVDGESTDGHSEESENQDESQQDRDAFNEGSQEDREPTFSSEEDATPYAFNNKAAAQPNASTYTSPSQSVAFTPTPAFPRPRARFNLPAPPSDLQTTPASRINEEQDDDQQHETADDLLTPHTRRRSFLLSVINSTTRPRMKFPTPHPKRFGTPSPGEEVESTPVPSTSGSSGTNLQSAFTGVTPRPRIAVARRMSHPLSQAVTAPSGASGLEPSPVAAVARPAAWATPAHSSPYDGVGDRASFISTASSHDLTTHHRVNTSFDPAMGFGSGAPGHGVGRFNAGKLNTYLHGLNRRLQEENELLMERLRKLDEEKKSEPSTTGAVAAESSRRLSVVGRRASGVGTALGNVQEDMAEGWLEEKAELEDEVEAFKIEVMNCMAEKVEVEQALDREKEERHRDKERFDGRMSEVEKGVTVIIADLEQKVAAAEKQAKVTKDEAAYRVKEMEKAVSELQAERDVAMERAEKAERVLESGKELGGALKEANDRVGQVMGDLRNANAQIKELEEEVMRSDARIDELEKDLKEDKEIIASLEDELASRSDALAVSRAEMMQLESTVRQLDEELRLTKGYVDELEEGAGEAVERIDQLQEELASAQETIKVMSAAEAQASHDLKTLRNEAMKAQETARQMEEALEEAEEKMMHDEEALSDLRSKLTSLERERQREESREISRVPVEAGPTEEEYQALEQELDEADKEIARLNAVLNQSPARKAMDRAKDTKIEMLEREKEELLERNRALRLTFNEMTTPNKLINASGISPIHRQVLSMSIRAPKTPGGPLRDMSWLHSTNADPSVTPLISEINRLQRELDRANESIDDKLDKLEDAGLGVVGLTKKLEDARARIVSLEDEIARLNRKEERRSHRLERVRCQKCNIKVDLQHLIQGEENSTQIWDNLPTEPPTPPTRTSEALKANLQSVNQHLEELKKQWEAEKKKLVGEKAILEDAANRLNGQVKNTKEEAKRAAESTRAGEKTRANAENELEKAKRTISVLESELSSERSRLRNMISEQERMQREKKQVLTDLQRTESDMDGVKQQLQRFKKENNELEKELRENVNIEQKARLLETRVVENTETIEQLRQERSLLAADHKELQRRFAEISETANNLRNEYVAHSTSHDNRRHELDLHRLEIDDLRRALDDRANDLQRVEKEKKKIATEKGDVARTVAALEADLRRVKQDAEAFGRDLKLLRSEKGKLETKNNDEIAKAERSKKQAQTQIRLLNEQLDAQKERTTLAVEQLKSHVCAADEGQVSKLKLQHNRECKGLMVQIRYLKAKFTRESFFRGDLTYQKQYLLVILSQFEKSERTIFASIARIGFPVVPPLKRKACKLKSVALMIVFLSRVKRSSESWRQESASKQAVAKALEEVRRKRVTGV
ncbi:hypothetical protein GALMADRAFT_241215 [Galerina marginata CBS 339.88]|uniref:Pericentrin/AKAP-450 centrosomal targeting domain-containing protein n=1 Tax=Galerina marginata (strain CBS 339.88) TaxID=685588 RepID=A0A067TLI3_GALM3|nr:hypothetical protein GALMADRAFT_241215 [Galerina marginata CBS 339.88]